MDEAVQRAAQGHGAAARQALVDAYLNGVEPVEPLLRSRDPELVTRIEDGFRRARVAADRTSPRFAHEAEGLSLLLAQGPARGGSGLPRF